MGRGFGLVQANCPPPPGLKTPPVPPDSSTGFGVGIGTVRSTAGGNVNVCGLFVSCAETGVSYISDGTTKLYYANAAGTATFSTPGGPGGDCPANSGHTYSSGTRSTLFGAGPPYGHTNLFVTQTS